MYKAGNTNYDIKVVADTAGFAALRPEWGQLLQNSAVNCMFLTWEWLYVWWRHLAGGSRLHILTIRHRGVLIGIVPLCRRPVRPMMLHFFRTFGFLGTGEVGSDYLDIIVHYGHEDGALRELARYLGRHKIVLELSQVNRQSPHITALIAMLESNDWKVSGRSTHVCPYINLSGHTWETYLDSVGSSHRYNFRRRLKNLSQRYDMQFEKVETEQQINAILPRLIELHNCRWSNRGGSDAFHTPGLLGFHNEFSRIALQRGWLRLFALRLNGRIVAALYGFRYKDVFYFYQSGFDIEFSRDSVGMVIMGLVIKDAIEEGIATYDFLHGDEEYKYRWASQQSALSAYIFAPPCINGMLYRGNMQTRRMVKKLTRKYFHHPAMARLFTNLF